MYFPYVNRGLKVKPTRGIPIWHNSNSSILTPTITLLKKPLTQLSCVPWSLSLCKSKKKLLEPIQSYDHESFSHPKWSICHKWDFFLKKPLILSSLSSWTFSLYKIKQKTTKTHHLRRQKWSFCPMR